MLNLAQKVYLASLARKEAAMPWEDDNSALPEVIAGLGGAGAAAGAVYGPGQLQKLMSKSKKLRDMIEKGNSFKGINPSDAAFEYAARLGLTDADKATYEKTIRRAQRAAKFDQGLGKHDNKINKILKAISKKKGGRAAAVAALAGLTGASSAGIAHLFDN